MSAVPGRRSAHPAEGFIALGLFSLPYWAVMAAFVAGAVVVGCGAHALVRRFVPYRDLADHNDVAGFIIAIVGVIYAVLLAFVVVVVWQQYNDSDTNYGSEVSAAADVHAFARSLPAGPARITQMLVHQYIHEMIVSEWPAMMHGGRSSTAALTLAHLSQTVARVRPADLVQAQARQHLLESVQHLFDLRNKRLSDNSETMPPVLWAALILGAIITVGFGYLFGVVNFRIQLIMTGCVAALIGIMFALLVELDFPFRRDTAIDAARWVELQRYLDATGDLASARVPARYGMTRREIGIGRREGGPVRGQADSVRSILLHIGFPS